LVATPVHAPAAADDGTWGAEINHVSSLFGRQGERMPGGQSRPAAEQGARPGCQRG
jgi:hypothetical protein